MGAFPVRGSIYRIGTSPVTLTLIGLMTLATLLDIALPHMRVAIRLGLTEMFDPEDSWCLVTWLFSQQFGTRHLLLNGFATPLYGPYLERALGGAKFLALYLLAGVVGGAWTTAVAPDNSLSGSAGASLAVFGLFGGMTGASAAAARASRSFAPLRTPSVVVGAVLALMVVLTAVAVTTRGCNLGAAFAVWGVIAHSPGLVAGALLGFAFARGHGRRQLVAIGAAGALLAASAIFLIGEWAPWPTLPSAHEAELARCIDVDG